MAESERAVKVCETSGAPVVYLPPEDVAGELLRPASGKTLCEFKGTASYLDLVTPDRRIDRAAWTYRRPTDSYTELSDYVSFYPALLEAVQVSWLRQVVGKLLRPGKWPEQRRGGQIGDAEAVADEVVPTGPLTLDVGERGLQRAPCGCRIGLGERVPMAHVEPAEREGHPHHCLQGSGLAVRDERPHVLTVLAHVPEQGPSERVPDLLVEAILDLERALPQLRVGGIQRRLRLDPLERGDDVGRVGVALAADVEDRQRSTQRKCHRPWLAGHQRAAPVRDSLVVEGPARLLVVVREVVLPELRGCPATAGAHDALDSTAISERSIETRVGRGRERRSRRRGSTRRRVGKARPSTLRCSLQ